MDRIIRGRVWKYGDDVNTDVIFPGKYTYTVRDEADMAKHALEDLDPSFASSVQPDDIIVGGRNWGCGSSREQAVTAVRQAGVKVIIAKSFARIYFRNAVNGGLLPIACPEAVDALQAGEVAEVDLIAHTITSQAGTFSFPPLSPSILKILEAGGLVPMLRRQLSEAASAGQGGNA
jgi:3-isopropylmalate/(R)-2-methylmalate dehydratase small subunit